MAASFGRLLKMLGALLAVCVVNSKDEEDSSLKECAGKRHVCTTLMRYPDGTIANEGPYCTCSNGDCGAAWGEGGDERALTWKHYERVHWKVQYRFCTPIVETSLHVCGNGERAAVVETEVNAWSPYLPEMRCRCRDGILHMVGWKKEGLVWKYFYECEKRECSPEDVCADIYVDESKKVDIVTEVLFRCACPQGDMCPAKVKDESAVKGRQVQIRCEPIKTGEAKVAA